MPDRNRPAGLRTRRITATRVFVTSFIVLALWGGYSLLTHTPTGRNWRGNESPTPSSEAPIVVATPPPLTDIGIPAFHLLPSGALAGLYISAGSGAREVVEAFKAQPLLDALLPGLDISTIPLGLKGDLLLCVYEGESGIYPKGIVHCSSDADAAQDFELLATRFNSQNLLAIPGLPPMLVGRLGNSISLAVTEMDLRLLPPTDDKPIPRLSRSEEVQAMAGSDSPVFAFAAVKEIVKLLNRRYPSISPSELTVTEIAQALDLHSVTSAAISIEAGEMGPVSRIVMEGVRGEGLAGLVSTYSFPQSSALHLPSSVLFYASETMDVARFIQAAGGFLALTNKEERLRIPEEMTEVLSKLNFSPGLLARSFNGEASLAVAIDGPLPQAWLSVQIGDRDVLKSVLSVCKAQNLLTTRKSGDSEVFMFARPISLGEAGGFPIAITPCIGIVGEYCVLASDLSALNTAIAISEGKRPALAAEENFARGLRSCGAVSSFVFARPAKAAKLVAPLMGSFGFDPASLPVLDDVFWSGAKRTGMRLEITQLSSVPIPVVNHIARPSMAMVGLCLAPSYDRLITMALKAVNWVGTRLCYYEVQHMDLNMDLRGEVFGLDAAMKVKTLVQGSTGFIFALNPNYEIKAVELDGNLVNWGRTGPFVTIPSAPIDKDSVNTVRIVAKGLPRDMLEIIPRQLLAAFSVSSHPVRTDTRVHLAVTSLFYPIAPVMRESVWTSTTALDVPDGWLGVSNGRPVSETPIDGGVRCEFADDRPDMALEVFAAPFVRVTDKADGFTVHHYFEPGSVEKTDEAVGYANRCFSFYKSSFGGNYEPDPLVVHLKKGDGISHCLSYIVMYTRSATVLSHELAHLWWGSLVKMHPLHSSMWYEGLTEYSNAMFIHQEFGAEYHAKYLNWRLNGWRSADNPPRPYRDIRMWSPGRGIVGYLKGVAIFRGLHGLMGPEKFGVYLKGLASRGGEFVDIPIIWEELTKVAPDLDWYARAMLYGNGHFDLEIESVTRIEGDRWLVLVRSRGFHFWRGPVRIIGKAGEFTFDTSFEPSRRSTTEVEIQMPGEPELISLDPEQFLPELAVENNSWVRAAPQGEKKE